MSLKALKSLKTGLNVEPVFVRRLVGAPFDDDSVGMKFDERERVSRRLDGAVERNVRDVLADAETAFVQVSGEKRFNARMPVENV